MRRILRYCSGSILFGSLILFSACSGADDETARRIDGWQNRFQQSTDRIAEMFKHNPHQVSPAMLRDRCHNERNVTSHILAEMREVAAPEGDLKARYDAIHAKVSDLHRELDACITGDYERVPWARSRTHYD